MRSTMRCCLAVLAVSFVVSSWNAAAFAGDLVLADQGKSAYSIVVADNASPSTKYGAAELQKFLEEMTGAKLPIVSDQQPAGPKEIVLGDNAHFQTLKTGIDIPSLGKEGYVIRTVGDCLVIAGGSLRGNMYGVYGLLEDHLGCRWFTPDCSRIPKTPKLVLPTIDERQVPAMEYREPFVTDCYNGDWCARNRMNSSSATLEEKHGGKVSFGDGFFCHTFAGMVPPDKYFKEHPEYFSLVKGERKKGYAQLCCTNPDVIRICTEAVRAAMAAQPQATVFSVSQNDCDEHCECPNCQAVAAQEESQMGPVLQLVNKVAEAVEKDFPDKIIETLAYQWTRKPPKQMRPRPNVVIRFCSIECCFSHPLATCDSPQNKAFCNDMEAWAKIAPRLWVWDYATNFGGYLYPFPNQRVRGPNVKYYADHNVKGLFEQDTYQTLEGELSALGGYITAKCLWNPNYDPNVATNEFLDAYYGKAAGAVRGYINLIHDHVEQKNIHMPIGFDAKHPVLDDEVLVAGNAFWQQAEEAAAADPTVLQRVKYGRMSLDYAIVERSRLEAQKQIPVNERLVALVRARLNPFIETLKKSPVTCLREGGAFDKTAYCTQLASDLQPFVASAASAAELLLTDGGKSAYQIVVADKASPSTKHAAEELQRYLEEMTGAKLAIVSDQQPAGPKEIVLGDNAHFQAMKTGIDIAMLGKEGYVIRTVGDHLVIAGGDERGCIYGVYGLLEDHLGCRWFTPDCSRIPKSQRLTLGALDDRQVPALEYREPYMVDCLDAEWCVHNRMNSSMAGLQDKHGGKVMYGNGFFVHTFNTLVPPAKYFAEHPEYYSLVKDKRLKDNSQLCCTNPDVIRICTERILEEMRKQPKATVFSVSQNDCANYCECPNCKALAEQEGTQMAPVLQMVNRIAEAAGKEFPDKIVDTLAYQWTRKAPKSMRPLPNVVIRLCSIECCFSHPLGTCDGQQNTAFRADMEAWAKVASRLWVWDYSTNFSHYLLPFPNRRVLEPNTQFYIAHNVKGIFEEDTPDTRDSEFVALDGYIMAKCFWNPNYDVNKAIREFTDAYYGKAAETVRAYLDLIQDHVEKENLHMPIYFDAGHATLNDELLAKANDLWQKAEEQAAGDAVLLQRVKVQRMVVDYAIVERARFRAKQKMATNEAATALAKARYQPFIATLEASQVTRLHEGQPLDKAAYRRDLAKDLGIEVQ